MFVKGTHRNRVGFNLIGWTVLFSITLLVISCSKIENFTEIDTPRYSGEFAPASTDEVDQLKVVTFNIEFAKKIDQAIEELRTSDALKDADLISLQEMDEVGSEAIAKALEYNYVYYPSSVNTDGGFFGLAVLSKWPIVNDEKILLPHAKPINERKNIAISAEVKIGSKVVRVYNIHAGTFILPKAKRRDQFMALMTHLNEKESTQPDEHVIIAGDFNTDKSNDIDYLVDLYTAEGFEWASEDVGPTYQTFSGLSKFTLDHFFTRGLQVLEAGKPKETKASDHLPMWMDIELK